MKGEGLRLTAGKGVVHLSIWNAQDTMGHKEDPAVTLGICGAVGERAQVKLLWVRYQLRIVAYILSYN